MDYEKKYKEALERAKKFIEANPLVQNLEIWIKETFPELAESDSERIRKALKEYFINSFQNNGVAAICGVHIIDILTWLEKQGESYTKRDVDNAFIEGMASAKDELDKQAQKPAWSEEDKLVVEDIEAAVINYWHGQSQEDLLDWLKALKQRMGG